MSAQMPAQMVATEAGLQALVDECNRERGYARARVIQAVFLVVLGFAIMGAAGQWSIGLVAILVVAILLGVNSGKHSRRARDLDLQARLAAEALGYDVKG